MQMCHYKSAKLPSVPAAQCAGEVSSVWSLVAGWRPFLVTTPSELRQCSASCPRTSTNAGHPRSGTVTVTTLARGHSGHVATGPLSRTSERLATGVERVRRHDSGRILLYSRYIYLPRFGNLDKTMKIISLISENGNLFVVYNYPVLRQAMSAI